MMERIITKGSCATRSEQSFAFETPDPFIPQRKEESAEPRMQNGRTTDLYHRRFLTIDGALCRVQVINLMLLVFYVSDELTQFQFDFENTSAGVYNDIVFMVLMLIAACALAQVPMMVFRAVAKYQLDYYQCKTIRKGLSPNELTRLILELLVGLLQPYWPLNELSFEADCFDEQHQTTIPFQFKVNHLLTLLSLIRLYWLGRSHLLATQYMDQRSQRIAKMYLCKADALYALKSAFKDYPNYFVCSYFFGSVLVFSFAIRVSERYRILIFKGEEEGHLLDEKFEDITNAVYLAIITMTTVGYGDLKPITSVGRAVCCLLVVWSVILVSVMVVVLNNTFQMEQREIKVLSLINKLDLREELRDTAANIIKLVYRWRKFLNVKYLEGPKHRMELQNFERKYKKLKKEFSAIYKTIKNIDEDNDVYFEMSRNFDCLIDDLQSLSTNQDRLINFFHDNIEDHQTLKAFLLAKEGNINK